MEKIILREFREMPFCRQDKSVLRKINNKANRKEIGAIRNTYFTLTEVASNQETEKISIFLFDIAKISGLSEKTISKCLDFLVTLGVVYMKPQERGPDGRYKNKEIWLVSNKSTVGKFKKTSKKVGKKIKKRLVPKLSDNKENNIEDIIEDNLEVCVGKEITHPKLIIWNSITGLSDIENSELKKSLDGLKNVSDNEFELRVKKFVFIKNLIQNTKSEKYFFFQIQERDLITFIKNINKFYGEDTVILGKLSLASERKKALRLVIENKITEEIDSVDKRSPLTEEDKKKALALLSKARKKL